MIHISIKVDAGDEGIYIRCVFPYIFYNVWGPIGVSPYFLDRNPCFN